MEASHVTTPVNALSDRVRQQRDILPDLYGGIDVARVPHRHTDDPAVASALPAWTAERGPMLEDRTLVELLRVATLLGDPVADAFASSAPAGGVPSLFAMLRTACRGGVDAVPDAPVELRNLISAMEVVPSWIDRTLVDEGSRFTRPGAAFMAPFTIRGAFLGTFLNTYAAEPMALTGALSGPRAVTRVRQTAAFFASTSLPGALDRHGPGFEAAAVVRLTHAVVRHHLLTRADRWDADVGGVPVPQVDQVPAGLGVMYAMAVLARRRGRTEFNRRERAMLELARFRCFLLGMPRELLPTTATGVVELVHGRAAVLRDDFDDRTCGELVRSTMEVSVRDGARWWSRTAEGIERSWGKAVFVRAFCGGDRVHASRMGVRLRRRDILAVVASAPFVVGRFALMSQLIRVPGLGRIADRHAVRVLRRRVRSYGSPPEGRQPGERPTCARHALRERSR
ncbi:MAG: oxygenase MpaB family protein [Marmoricola sp.]